MNFSHYSTTRLSYPEKIHILSIKASSVFISYLPAQRKLRISSFKIKKDTQGPWELGKHSLGFGLGLLQVWWCWWGGWWGVVSGGGCSLAGWCGHEQCCSQCVIQPRLPCHSVRIRSHSETLLWAIQIHSPFQNPLSYYSIGTLCSCKPSLILLVSVYRQCTWNIFLYLSIYICLYICLFLSMSLSASVCIFAC